MLYYYLFKKSYRPPFLWFAENPARVMVKDIDSKDYDNPKIQTCLMSKKESVQAFEGNWENPKESK